MFACAQCRVMLGHACETLAVMYRPRLRKINPPRIERIERIVPLRTVSSIVLLPVGDSRLSWPWPWPWPSDRGRDFSCLRSWSPWHGHGLFLLATHHKATWQNEQPRSRSRSRSRNFIIQPIPTLFYPASQRWYYTLRLNINCDERQSKGTCLCHGHGHGHGIFILATHPEGTWTTNPKPSFTQHPSADPTRGPVYMQTRHIITPLLFHRNTCGFIIIFWHKLTKPATLTHLSMTSNGCRYSLSSQYKPKDTLWALGTHEQMHRHPEASLRDNIWRD